MSKLWERARILRGNGCLTPSLRVVFTGAKLKWDDQEVIIINHDNNYDTMIYVT